MPHDVRKPGHFPPLVPLGSHQMSPSVKTILSCCWGGGGCKLPENRTNVIILAPLVLQDFLLQSGKAAKLIHNPLWSFSSYTWQLKSKRGSWGAVRKRKGIGWDNKTTDKEMAWSDWVWVSRLWKYSLVEKYSLNEIFYLGTHQPTLYYHSLSSGGTSLAHHAQLKTYAKGMLRPLNISIYDNLFLWDF